MIMWCELGEQAMEHRYSPRLSFEENRLGPSPKATGLFALPESDA